VSNVTVSKFLHSVANFQFLFVIILTIFTAFVAEPYMSIFSKSVVFSISNFIRSLLLFLLPLLILPYIVNVFTRLKASSVLLISLIILLVLVSNFSAIIVGYIGDTIFMPKMQPSNLLQIKSHSHVTSLFEFMFPELISIEKTIIIGFIVGILLNFSHNKKIEKIFEEYYKLANFFFQKIMTPLIPLYIFGIIIKLNHEAELKKSFSLFGNMFLTIIFIQILYLLLLFFIGSNFKLSVAWQRLKNSFPAALTGFCTMSRVVSLPVILNSAEKNCKNPLIARVTAPMIMNAHAIGECISLPIVILTVMKINDLVVPDFATYLKFAIVLALAQFSAVSIPGGSLIILMPFLSSYFGFSQDMIALMFAFDIFFDSIGTAMNTFGDLAFISFIDKIWAKFSKKDEAIEIT
jgi:Na+/H+-dicarboxylate symporter